MRICMFSYVRNSLKNTLDPVDSDHNIWTLMYPYIHPSQCFDIVECPVHLLLLWVLCPHLPKNQSNYKCCEQHKLRVSFQMRWRVFLSIRPRDDYLNFSWHVCFFRVYIVLYALFFLAYVLFKKISITPWLDFFLDLFESK